MVLCFFFLISIIILHLLIIYYQKIVSNYKYIAKRKRILMTPYISSPSRQKTLLNNVSLPAYITTSNSQINVSTLEEKVRHITPEFPYMTDLCLLHTCPGSIFPWHWHNEVEFFYLRSGSLNYHLPHDTYTFRQGEGGFINAGILHMTSCSKGQTCIQEEHIFHPSFLGGQDTSILMSRYVTPIIENPNVDLVRFDSSCPVHEEIISLMKSSFDCYQEKREGYEFDVREHMTRLWRILFSLTRDLRTDKKKRPQNDRIKTMMEYVASHYHEKLTLKQLADSAFISPRECSRCFQETLGQSPFSYIMDYRLRKACDFLSRTQLSVTEISIVCGFNSSSYFGQAFHESFGCSPREYRNQNTVSSNVPH